MKNALIVFLLAAPGLWAQESVWAQGMGDGLFEETLDGMFSHEPEPDLVDDLHNATPPPPVPVDGGLVALLAAGGAVGYRRYRVRRAKKSRD
jgi:hypothetical protein